MFQSTVTTEQIQEVNSNAFLGMLNASMDRAVSLGLVGNNPGRVVPDVFNCGNTSCIGCSGTSTSWQPREQGPLASKADLLVALSA